MKSAYEISMERFNIKNSQKKPITNQQRIALSKINTNYKIKIIEREIFLKSKIKEAIANNCLEDEKEIRKQLINEKLRLQEECEEKKNIIRNKI